MQVDELAGRPALDDDLADHPLVEVALDDQGLPALAGDRVALGEEDGDAVAVAGDEAHRHVEQFAHLLGRRGGGGGDRHRLGDQLVDQGLVDREEEVFLLADVVVEAGLAEADRFGDVRHRGGVVAALAEDPGRRFDDVGAEDGRRW